LAICALQKISAHLIIEKILNFCYSNTIL